MQSANIFTYTILFDRSTEGGYIASVPLLPGCMTQGETFEQARDNIKDAIQSYISVLKEDGDEVPMEHEEHIAATVSVLLLA